MLSAVENLAVWRPPRHQGFFPFIGHADGQAALEGHGVDFGWPLVFGGESEGTAIRRNCRMEFAPMMRGQSLGKAAFSANFP